MSKKIIAGIFLPIILMFSLTSCTAKEKVVTATQETTKKEVEIKISEEELEKQISSSILATAERYSAGELSTQAHKTLGTSITDNKLTAYVIASVSNYAFENNKFTMVSGSGCVPTVIEYEIGSNNRFKELKYLEAEDSTTTKALFPDEYQDFALDPESFSTTLTDSMNKYAQSYLDTLNRDVEIVNFQEKKLLDFPIKTIDSLAKYPDWIGSTEYIEGNVRYIYSVSQTTLNEEDVFNFTKTDENDKVIESFILNDKGELIQ